jgi:MerR family transcriptional regulator/heat shock protein HspR
VAAIDSSAQPARQDPDGDRGVYGISVAAELLGLGVQTLRLYEARGLVNPSRSEGGTRRYSANDLERIRRITQLLGAGLNLAGIAQVLILESENAQLRRDAVRGSEKSADITTARRTGRMAPD